jgi:hypothetical protein
MALWRQSLVHIDHGEERRSWAQVLTSAGREATWADHCRAEDGDKEAVERLCIFTTSMWIHGCSDQASGVSLSSTRKLLRESGLSMRFASTHTTDHLVVDLSTGNADSPKSGTQSIEVCRWSTLS